MCKVITDYTLQLTYTATEWLQTSLYKGGQNAHEHQTAQVCGAIGREGRELLKGERFLCTVGAAAAYVQYQQDPPWLWKINPHGHGRRVVRVAATAVDQKAAGVKSAYTYAGSHTTSQGRGDLARF
jgi:hypothetical protein